MGKSSDSRPACQTYARIGNRKIYFFCGRRNQYLAWSYRSEFSLLDAATSTRHISMGSFSTHRFDFFSLYSMYIIELVLPFFFFLPGNFRRFAMLGQIILQIAILLSGNYGFFNLLTLSLCIPLLDDQILPARIKMRFNKEENIAGLGKSHFRISFLFLLTTIFLSTFYGHLINDLRGNQLSDQELEVPNGFNHANWSKNTLLL